MEFMKLYDEKSPANDSFYYFIISRGLNENTWIEYNVNNDRTTTNNSRTKLLLPYKFYEIR